MKLPRAAQVESKVCEGCAKEFPIKEFLVGRKKVAVRPRCRPCWSEVQKVKDATPENRYSALKAQCKVQKVHVNMSFEFFKDIITKPCHYCGGPGPRYGKGMDRIAYAGGYTKDNVVPACGICNDLRGVTFTVEEAKLIGAAVRQIREARAAKGEPPLLRGLEVKKLWHKQGINPEASRRKRWGERIARIEAMEG
jgi:hypothetical protein